MNYAIVISFAIFAIWLIRRDTARRDGISPALWIPTLWAFILLSRPLSMWLGFGGGTDNLEGSPVDRLSYLILIGLAFLTVSRRGIQWSALISQNWPVFLFYGYLLVSVFWAESSLVSFKRWFKDFGNIIVALVILTEANALVAMRTVFVRCAYVLIPLSIIFVRYFPELGRRYSRAGGLEVTGVTTQKNSLGMLVVVCGLVLLWDWLERPRDGRSGRLANWVPLCLLLLGAYLLYLCDSQTSIFCLVVGVAILLCAKAPLIRSHPGALGTLSLAAVGGYFLLDWFFGIKNAALGMMGREPSFTGRTDVWRELLALKTDPLIGTGFYSLWSNQFYISKLPEWVGFSAHNGFLEVYLDGGWIGLMFLGIMLAAVTWRANRQLAQGGKSALFQFATLAILLIGSISESHFGRMGPLWFLFLLTAIEGPWRAPQAAEPKPEFDIPSRYTRDGHGPLPSHIPT